MDLMHFHNKNFHKQNKSFIIHKFLLPGTLLKDMHNFCSILVVIYNETILISCLMFFFGFNFWIDQYPAARDSKINCRISTSTAQWFNIKPKTLFLMIPAVHSIFNFKREKKRNSKSDLSSGKTSITFQLVFVFKSCSMELLVGFSLLKAEFSILIARDFVKTGLV